MPTDDRPAAYCDDCGKRFRVPDATKTYRCKDCGGVVRIPKSAQSDSAAHAEDAALDDGVKPQRSTEVREPGNLKSVVLATNVGSTRHEEEESKLTRELSAARRAAASAGRRLATIATVSTLIALFTALIARHLESSDPDHGPATHLPYLILAIMFLVIGAMNRWVAFMMRRNFSLGVIVSGVFLSLCSAFIIYVSITERSVPNLIHFALFGMTIARWGLLPFAQNLDRLRAIDPDLLSDLDSGRRKKPNGRNAVAGSVAYASSWVAVLAVLITTWPSSDAQPTVQVRQEDKEQAAKRAASVDAFPQAVLEAWNANDLDRVAALTSSPPDYKRALERAMQREELDRLPRAASAEYGVTGERKRQALLLETSAGEWALVWAYSKTDVQWTAIETP